MRSQARGWTFDVGGGLKNSAERNVLEVKVTKSIICDAPEDRRGTTGERKSLRVLQPVSAFVSLGPLRGSSCKSDGLMMVGHDDL